ncbi:MAG: hypothetical protein V1652_01315 [bacterium]
MEKIEKDTTPKEANLLSSVRKKGKTVTQIITCVSGIKKTFRGIKTDTIENGQFTKFETTDGRMVLVNDQNVFCVEVFKEQPEDK